MNLSALIHRIPGQFAPKADTAPQFVDDPTGFLLPLTLAGIREKPLPEGLVERRMLLSGTLPCGFDPFFVGAEGSIFQGNRSPVLVRTLTFPGSKAGTLRQ